MHGTALDTSTDPIDIWELVNSTLEGLPQSQRCDSTGRQTQSSGDGNLGLDNKNTLELLDESLQHQPVEGRKSFDSGDGDSNERQKEIDYQAFRTTTAFLSIIQGLSDLRHPNMKEKKPFSDSNERLVLKLCHAFTVLAVIRHEVVAVSVGFKVDAPDTGSGLEVLLTEQDLTKLDLFFNQNPRKTDLAALNDLQGDKVLPPRAPADFDLVNGVEPTREVLEKYIRGLKVTRYDRTLEEHIWMLQTIFRTCRTKEVVFGPLMHYIIMTCFPKMWAHINHYKSLFYTGVLGSIRPQGTTFIKPKAPLGTSNNEEKAQFDTVAFALSTKRATKIENKHDREFLATFLIVRPSNTYSTLRKHSVKMGKDQSLCLYNENTCEEFCSSVDYVLKGFRENLSKFNAYKSALSNPVKSKVAMYMPKDVDQYGHMLHKLTRGAALRMYLENVNALLSDFHHPPPPKRVFLFKSSTEAARLEALLDAEIDIELQSGREADYWSFDPPKPEDTTAPLAWQVCLRWIKLLVSYFSAASMLVSHICKPEFPPINVRLLRNSPGETSLLPWKDLLKNPKYFPLESAKGYEPETLPDRSNTNIVETINQAILCNPYKHGSNLNVFRNLWGQVMESTLTESETHKIADALDKRFKEFHDTIGIPACRSYAQQIRSELKVWKKGATQNSMSASLIMSNIMDNITSMMEICYLFSQMQKSTFTGTVHCEANLANYLVHRDASSDSMDSPVYNRIIAVSKENCPSCHALLGFLRRNKPPFLSMGAHRTVFPCSLPLNVEQSVVDQMNSLFGAQLRKGLVDFLNNMGPRRRTYSTGSEVVSDGSERSDSPDREPGEYAPTFEEEEVEVGGSED
ncbi:hypothetical protein GALMADRAFT_219293 [Galerina marginata CBS 339.88]|uniref:Uncharacterized protein n=1 Tax=Galerina marginata (strain CBS 339.88) TaxID=685588 RepID=A0A067TK22_GALM3|nr:hypothetical protein GALMADRAFT_219293 [Galerina marginata CBS 339.88]